MKGLEKLKEKLPKYQGKKLFPFLLIAIITFLSSILFQLFIDSIPRIFRFIEILQIIAPIVPILGSLTVIIIGFLLVYLFWKNKNKFLDKYGILAYQKAFKFMLIGIPLVISVVIHSLLPTDLIFPYLISKDLSWYLATSLFDIFFSPSVPIFLIRLILGFFFVGLGLIVVSKTLKIFGIDNMGLVYVYFPEESRLQDHEIYSILRHPTYHALMLISIGSIFLRFSIYSILYFLIFMIGINIHLKYVEEKELVRRFGESYREYTKNVPAFLVKVKDLKKYFNFIFNK